MIHSVLTGFLLLHSMCDLKAAWMNIQCSLIIIIMSCCRHGYPWPSLATSPYRSSPLIGLQGHIPYPHIAAECMFELVILLLPGHMWGSIGVHHLLARPCFSRLELMLYKSEHCDAPYDANSDLHQYWWILPRWTLLIPLLFGTFFS